MCELGGTLEGCLPMKKYGTVANNYQLSSRQKFRNIMNKICLSFLAKRGDSLRVAIARSAVDGFFMPSRSTARNTSLCHEIFMLTSVCHGSTV